MPPPNLLSNYWLCRSHSEEEPSTADLRVPFSQKQPLHLPCFWLSATPPPDLDHMCLRSQPQTNRFNQHPLVCDPQEGFLHYAVSPPSNLQKGDTIYPPLYQQRPEEGLSVLCSHHSLHMPLGSPTIFYCNHLSVSGCQSTGGNIGPCT